MQHCESINLDEYRQSGEGGTAITYKHNSRNSLAKLYKSGFEADMAIEEFKVAQAVYDLGIPTPKPYSLQQPFSAAGTDAAVCQKQREVRQGFRGYVQGNETWKEYSGE